MTALGGAARARAALASRPEPLRAVRAARLLTLTVLVVYLAAMVVRPPGEAIPWLDRWLFAALLVLCCALAVARPLLRRGDRVAWSLLAVGMIFWLAGDLTWHATSEADEAATASYLYFWLYPCAGAAVLLLASRRNGSGRRLLWLDGLVAGLGAAAVAALAFGPVADAIVAEGPAAGPASVLVDLAFPVADLMLLTLTLAVMGARGWRLTRAWWCLGAGCVLLVVADTNFLLQEAAETYQAGSIWDAGWAVAFVAFGLAGWQPSTQPKISAGRPALVVPALVTAASVAVLVAATTSSVPALAIGLAATALLGAVLRTGLTIRELEQLVESRQLAVTDELTGLGNRRMLRQRLDTLLARRRPGESLAVLLLDLDRFKEVNDALGHHMGDELLRRVGPRLAGVLRDDDLLARLGGDEFALLLGPSTQTRHAEAVAQRVRDALRAPFRLDDVELHLDVSIGIALCPDHAATSSGLLQRADVAMYEAKRNRTGHALYCATSDVHDRERLTLIAQLHTAVAARQLVCHYQPQCELATGRITGVEALVRWEHPHQGILGPPAFLGLSEQVGLMATLTRHVLDMALRDCSEWRAAGLELTVSVNLSGSSLSDETLPGDLARLLARHDLPARQLVLEVTEDVMVVDAPAAEAVVGRLQALGVGLSIDDYGTGYSSLTQLRTLPVSELKLDRSYLAGLGHSARDAAIVRSTVALAHALDLVVVAEGVETADDWQELTRLGCDRAQGFLLSPAMPSRPLLTWLRNRTGGHTDSDAPARLGQTA
jgi:diguanylate cyclase